MQTRDLLNAELEAIVSSLPTRSKIFLPTDKISLEEKVLGLNRVKHLYTSDSRALYSKRMQNLKTGMADRKRCFVIGNGPSLNKTDLSLLKNEITFAVNGFFLEADDLDWTPTFYVVEDHLVAEDRAEFIKDFKGPIKFFPIYLGYCLPESDDTIFYNHRPRVSYPEGFDFSLNADEITYAGCTVTFSALQLAAYLGFKEIYLIGVDADYEIPSDVKNDETYDTSVLDMDTDDPNHFHPDYFGKGYRWHDPQVNKMIEAYAEARKVSDLNGITIRNATVGGKLEVFQRTDYSSLFSSSDSKVANPSEAPPPKLLLIDFTRMRHCTATGELKQTYLSNWPEDRLLHLYGEAGQNFGVAFNREDSGNSLKPDEVVMQIGQFEPDVILYRPVENRPDLHALAISLIADLKRPFLIWLMDDWPRSLKLSNPSAAEIMDEDITTLCKHANRCLAISEPMAGAFGARYGQTFEVLHNSVDHDLWKSILRKPSTNSECIVRYSGNLAPNLTLKVLLELAQAVEILAQDQAIRLEIHTQPHWQKNTSHHFDQFAHTTVSVTTLEQRQYYSWLANADILFIGNSFNEDARVYLQYSFANKIVEYLASARPIIAYGPSGLFSMDFLEKPQGVLRVKERSVAALQTALSKLAKFPESQNKLGQANRDFAFSKFDLDEAQHEFYSLITQVSGESFRGFTRPNRRKNWANYIRSMLKKTDFGRGPRFLKRILKHIFTVKK